MNPYLVHKKTAEMGQDTTMSPRDRNRRNRTPLTAAPLEMHPSRRDWTQKAPESRSPRNTKTASDGQSRWGFLRYRTKWSGGDVSTHYSHEERCTKGGSSPSSLHDNTLFILYSESISPLLHNTCSTQVEIPTPWVALSYRITDKNEYSCKNKRHSDSQTRHKKKKTNHSSGNNRWIRN